MADKSPHPLSKPSPWTIREGCTADWDRMRGNDKRRFCEHCQRFVHNISAMSQAERGVLARPENMRECVFYSRRADGEVADLRFLARLRRWFPFLRLVGWSALVALIPTVLSGCMQGKRRASDSPPATNQTSSVQSPP